MLPLCFCLIKLVQHQLGPCHRNTQGHFLYSSTWELVCIMLVGGYKMWLQWLEEMNGWQGKCTRKFQVGEICGNQYEWWLDFEVDTSELGAKVEDQVFNSLVHDFVAEILHYSTTMIAIFWLH
ncbi:hypothetical protein VNO77_05659 [Canavalia gladiata]|uniref:Uncharacterized protein n=1 Tax=Canavalia gladiata TaxID=3824 RepID=A0AAN9R5W4_CANGL